MVESPIGPIPVTLAFALDARAFLLTAALATGAGALAGLVPALGATRPNLLRDLNGAVAVARAGGRRWLLRDALVAGQLAATVPLLVLAGLLARSAVGTTAGVALGFDPDRIAAVGTDLNVIGYERERADRFVRDALERVQALPGVEAAALASRVPLDLSFSPQNGNGNLKRDPCGHVKRDPPVSSICQLLTSFLEDCSSAVVSPRSAALSPGRESEGGDERRGD